MHEHAGAQTPLHTPITAFLLSAETALSNVITEIYVREGQSAYKDSVVNIRQQVYELRLKEINEQLD